jgi:hypothetical protein
VREYLHISLDRHRDVVIWKLESLTDEQLRRPLTPSGTSLLGLAKHLAGVRVVLLDRRALDGAAAEIRQLGLTFVRSQMKSAADIVASYSRAREAADRVIAEPGMEEVGTAWFGETVSMRWWSST